MANVVWNLMIAGVPFCVQLLLVNKEREQGWELNFVFHHTCIRKSDVYNDKQYFFQIRFARLSWYFSNKWCYMIFIFLKSLPPPAQISLSSCNFNSKDGRNVKAEIVSYNSVPQSVPWFWSPLSLATLALEGGPGPSSNKNTVKFRK